MNTEQTLAGIVGALVFIVLLCVIGLVDQHNKIDRLKEEIEAQALDNAICDERIAQLTGQRRNKK